jgi:hypothetical protein
MPNNFDITLDKFPSERINEFYSLLELLRRGADVYDYTIKFIEYNGILLMPEYYICTNDLEKFTFSWNQTQFLSVFPTTVLNEYKYYGMIVGGCLDLGFKSLDPEDTGITLQLINDSDTEYVSIDGTTSSICGVSVKHDPIKIIAKGNHSLASTEIKIRVSDRINDLRQYIYQPKLKEMTVIPGDKFVIKYFVNINGRFIRSSSHTHIVSTDEIKNSEFIFLDDTSQKIASDLKIDEGVANVVLNERQKSVEFFKNTIDLPAFSTDDHKRIRRLILDWYSVHKASITKARGATDPFSLTKEELNELIMSFGYPYPHDIGTKDQKAAFLLELINFYHKKGTPRVLRDVLGFYGVSDAVISEWWIKKRDGGSGIENEFIPYTYQMSIFLEDVYERTAAGEFTANNISGDFNLESVTDDISEMIGEIDTDNNNTINISDLVSYLVDNNLDSGMKALVAFVLMFVF